MKVHALNGEFDTDILYREVNKNVEIIEELARTKPISISTHPIGFVIPLGTLGNAPTHDTQFKSNFHIVAYTIADELLDKTIDFKDFNTEDNNEQGQICKLAKQFSDLATDKFGKGWRITLFNVSLAKAIESMCKGSKDVDSMKKAMDELYTIVNGRVEQIDKTSEKDKWPHEVIELFYAPFRAISCEITKLVDRRSISDNNPIGICNNIVIETLVYDDYANGLRLLTNTESFASSKIRQHYMDSNNYLCVLKARVAGDDGQFRPIRQFAGKSKVGFTDIKSGSTERIIYNIVNKNYKHWSFISISSSLNIKLNCID